MTDLSAEDVVFGFFAGGFIIAMFVTLWDRAWSFGPNRSKEGR